MSYDLYFLPRTSNVDKDSFLQYFRGRENYKVEGTQAWYQNEDSGVYFVFEHNSPEQGDDPGHEFSFNMNYYRPSYFVLEAEPEVTSLVSQFNFRVHDPQMHGMGEGEYVPQLLVSGWQHGNEFGYSAVLQNKDTRPTAASLPTSRLNEVWKWNVGRRKLQHEAGESQFVPRIIFLYVDGQVITAAVWPDAIPSLIPEVDYLIIGRKELAPRSFFSKKEDTVFVLWAEISKLIETHSSQVRDGGFDLKYDRCPSDIAQFVRGLQRNQPSVMALSADQVLDREIIDKYAA